MGTHDRRGYVREDGVVVSPTTVRTTGVSPSERLAPGQLDRLQGLGLVDGAEVDGFEEAGEAPDDWGSLTPAARSAWLQGIAEPSDEDVMLLAEKRGLSATDLEEEVLDVKGGEAAAINNSGYEEQLTYLGRDPSEIDQHQFDEGDGIDELDDDVHAAKAEEAAAISEAGIRAQVEYLVERLGGKGARDRVERVAAGRRPKVVGESTTSGDDRTHAIGTKKAVNWERDTDMPCPDCGVELLYDPDGGYYACPESEVEYVYRSPGSGDDSGLNRRIPADISPGGGSEEPPPRQR